jgi:hypothetical protein
MKKLHPRERKALGCLSQHDTEYIVYGRLPAGIGEGTMSTLVGKGWVVTGTTSMHDGPTGWRITVRGQAALQADSGAGA